MISNSNFVSLIACLLDMVNLNCDWYNYKMS